jgi:hypothetical protein
MDIKKKLAFFLAEYELQMDQIKSIYARLGRKCVVFESEEISKEMVESAGYWMHNLYSAFEDLFKMVQDSGKMMFTWMGAFISICLGRCKLE